MVLVGHLVLVTLPRRTIPSGDVDPRCLRRVVGRVLRESGVRCERFQVCGMVFFDKSDLSQVRLGQSQRFPPYGGSGPEVRSLMRFRVETDWADTTRRENSSDTP